MNRVTLTLSAVARLKTLLAEHPEDPVVRLTLKDLDEHRLAVNITLESSPHGDDEVYTHGELTVAIEANSAMRMDGMTIDYQDPGGFLILHPPAQSSDGFAFPHRNGE
jgi:Fe-S cluster assembly iron-binding protein IscA